jgi:hypothetical protein
MSAMNHNILLFSGLCAALTACGAGENTGDKYEGASKKDAGVGNLGGSRPTLSVDAAAAGPGAGATPPEQEAKVDYLAPRAGERRVYVANPTRNTVTVIDSTTLAITEQSTGDTPTVVATVPGKDIALVINAGSHTLRILRDATPSAGSYPIVAKANAIAISPDGLHAVIWFDSSQSTSSTTSSSTTSAENSQEVSVVTLGAAGTADKAFSVSVGYHPSSVVFPSDSSAAFVVTDDGISELRFADLAGPCIAPFTRIDNGALTLLGPDAAAPPAGPDSGAGPDTVPPADDALPALDGGGSRTDGAARPDTSPVAPDSAAAKDTAPNPALFKAKAVDVSVTMSGDYAIARREGTAAILLIDLKAKSVSTAVLSSEVTDLDLVDAPSGAQAFAVLRGESKLVRIDIPAGFADQSKRKDWPFSGTTVGSVTISANGTYALLYTTAVPSKDLAVFDLVNERVAASQPVIHKAIRGVAVAPDERTALVLHTRITPTSTSATLSEQDIVDQSYGYTMVDLTTGYTKQQLTQADPIPFVITPDSSNAFVLLRDDKASIRTAERISLSNFLVTDFLLGSPPNSIAALSPATHKVFVGQVYSEGRISFIDWMSATGEVQSVTGFALNGRIQQ